jgi:hypothetical protein
MRSRVNRSALAAVLIGALAVTLLAAPAASLSEGSVNRQQTPTLRPWGNPHSGFLKVQVSCGENISCTLRLHAWRGMDFGGNHKPFRLHAFPKSIPLGVNEYRVVRLNYSSRLRRSVRRGLIKGERPVIRVRAHNPAEREDQKVYITVSRF